MTEGCPEGKGSPPSPAFCALHRGAAWTCSLLTTQAQGSGGPQDRGVRSPRVIANSRQGTAGKSW